MELLKGNEFKKILKEKTVYIEKQIYKFIPRLDSYQNIIFDAMEYSITAGGKRLRPMFIMEIYSLFGGDNEEEILPFMAAMEMIHTYSLVHDDLPAMDNDDYRRGKLTTHKKFGEDIGILAGDALLNCAYETALKGILLMQDKEKGTRALEVLAKKAGVFGMVGGQVVDVAMTGKELSASQIEFIYRLKTAALLEGAFMIGAILAGADDNQVKEVEKIGNYVGMAFQIQDDILDLTSTTQELGKPVHSDERNNKNTYVSLNGMDKSSTDVENYSKKALEILKQLPGENVFLNTLIMELIHRKK